jgi:AAA domain
MIDSPKLQEAVRENIETLCRSFFPNGKKVNGEWKLGDSSGADGNSLGVCLSDNKAGVWHDRATGEKGNFLKLLQSSKNLTFPDAAREISRCLGIDLEIYQQNVAIDWTQCTQLTPDQEQQIADWRGLTPKFVRSMRADDMLRTFGSNGDARWVFPIRVAGKVLATHSRPITWNGPRVPWAVYPTNEQGGPGMRPLIVGNLTKATTVHLSESTWDTLALCDKLALHETDGFAALCTRGATNDRLVSELPTSVREVYLWPQNDIAGKTWLKNVLLKLLRQAVAKVVITPAEHADVNDWLKAGASTDDLLRAISLSEPYTRDAVEPQQNPKLAAELEQAFPAKPAPPQEKPLRPMLSWIAYGRREVDRSHYHVGEGFLEVGGFVMLIGQSYVGKSTFITQLSICLSIGRSWLFFLLERPLKVMIVQAEDPANKLIKMGHMFKRMGLTGEEISLADQNTVVLTIRDLQDASAVKEIERHAIVFSPDVIVINPMTSYLGGSVYRDEMINAFLRVQLTPMLDRIKASAVVVHHPPKPLVSDKEEKDLTAFELQYGGAGMAALTNAPRGNMFLTHVDGDVFKLQVGKGFEDLGAKDTVAYLRRSKDQDGIMLWERCESEKAEEATEKRATRKANKQTETFVPYDRLLKCFKAADKYQPSRVIELSKKDLNKGKEWTKDALSQLVFEKKLAKTKEPNPRGQPFVFYHLPTVLEPATIGESQ